MITINITYSGEGQNARRFMEEMLASSVVESIRKEPGNIRYDYYIPVEDSESILLIDSWENQDALDAHHNSPMMKTIAELREKYDLHMKVERYLSVDEDENRDSKDIRV